MYDTAFTEHTLRQQVRKIDFLNFRYLRKEGMLQHDIEKALVFVRNPHTGLTSIKSQLIGSAVVRQISEYPLLLAFRKLNDNIKRSTKFSAPARDSIAASLFGVLSESVPYRVYKLDVHRFFESIRPQHVMRVLKDNALDNSPTARLVECVIDWHRNSSGEGLPRGLSISGTLADLVMAEFDAAVQDRPDVFFYRRYVDDVILITSGEEDQAGLISDLHRQLPEGLELKRQKLQIARAAAPMNRKKSKIVAKAERVEYLGYSFTFDAENWSTLDSGHRKVCVDIATRKISKIKSRPCKTNDDLVLLGVAPLPPARRSPQNRFISVEF